MFSPDSLRIVSGGQTGPDRAALDVALDHGLPVGGWCPAGRWAEDGPIPPCYPLRESASADPAERTRLNVLDSDATLVLSPQPLVGGTALTYRIATEKGRPVLVCDPFEDDGSRAVAWIGRHMMEGDRLNVAGPRESEAPGIQAASAAWLNHFLDAILATGRPIGGEGGRSVSGG